MIMMMIMMMIMIIMIIIMIIMMMIMMMILMMIMIIMITKELQLFCWLHLSLNIITTLPHAYKTILTRLLS